MDNQSETTFPEFAIKNNLGQLEGGHNQQQSSRMLPEKLQLLKKQQMISQITQARSSTTQNEENTSITCFICHEYYVKAVLTKCGHSFCQFCLQEYFLFSNQCPVCKKVIRDDEFTTNFALNDFVQQFIKSHHAEYMQKYEERINQYKNWKLLQNGLGLNFWAGMTIDVKDQNHVWCQGTVIRVISMKNQPIKILKIQYQNQNKFVQIEKIYANDERLAPGGFYTNRKQLPKYQYLLQKENANQ